MSQTVEWIPIAHLLPEDEGMYLVHAPSSDPEKPLILTAWFTGKNNPGYRWSLAPYWSSAVTHWMRLPKGPQ
jgi:hypothetical protein